MTWMIRAAAAECAMTLDFPAHPWASPAVAALVAASLTFPTALGLEIEGFFVTQLAPASKITARQ